MNDNIKDIVASLMVDASDTDIEKIAVAVIKQCALLNDEWYDSGKFGTFGDRLMAHFGVKE